MCQHGQALQHEKDLAVCLRQLHTWIWMHWTVSQLSNLDLVDPNAWNSYQERNIYGHVFRRLFDPNNSCVNKKILVFFLISCTTKGFFPPHVYEKLQPGNDSLSGRNIYTHLHSKYIHIASCRFPQLLWKLTNQLQQQQRFC